MKDFIFYLIGFPFFGNYRIFTYVSDFVCRVDVHESLKALQATAIVTPLKVYAFYSPQPENATATFASSDITITFVLLCQFGEQIKKMSKN